MSGANIVVWPLSKTLLRRVHYEHTIGVICDRPSLKTHILNLSGASANILHTDVALACRNFGSF